MINTATPVPTDQQEMDRYFAETGRHLIAEEKISKFVDSSKLGVASQWTHEATQDSTGDMLFTNVVYGGWCKAQWSSALVQRQADGTHKFTSLLKMPVIRRTTKAWSLTVTGLNYREDGRN